MIKNMSRATVVILVLSTLHVPTYPISSSTADLGAVFVAGACAGGSYKLWRDMPALEKIHPAFFGCASLVATGAVYLFLHSVTPAGRLKRANILLQEISRHTLAKTHFDDERSFFDTMQDEYLREDLPLISAYNHLISLLPDTHLAFGLINKAAAEVGRDTLLQEEYNSSLACANELFKNIAEALKRIREHKDYLPQLTIYKESLNSAKQTIAQEQIALAQLQMAQAHQSSTFLQWLKAIFLGR
jgi:hypothetical protein